MNIRQIELKSIHSDAVTIFRAATLAQTHVSNIYKQRSKLRAFKREDGTWMIPSDALREYIQAREERAKGILGKTARTTSGRVFKRQIYAVPLGEFLEYTGVFLRVDTYTKLEPPMGTAVAELELTVEVSYNADPDDHRSISLDINGCVVHQQRGKFWITLPDGVLSFAYRDDHARFEFSVFKDLAKAFPEVIPPALVQCTDELLRKKQEELSV